MGQKGIVYGNYESYASGWLFVCLMDKAFVCIVWEPDPLKLFYFFGFVKGCIKYFSSAEAMKGHVDIMKNSLMNE